MADSEEFRLKRLKHDQHLSRVFDEVMGLGDFAESSRGSATSSKSDGQEETKGVDKTSEQGEHLQVEEDSGASKQEGKTEEGMGDSSIPRISSTSSDQPHLLTMGTKEGGSAAGRSGGAALDNALDGLEEDEDWNFSLPMGNLEDSHKREAESKDDQAGVDKNGSQSDSLVQPREEEEEEDEEEGEHEHEKDGSSQSSNTSHSSQDHTPDNSQDDGALNPAEETEDSQDGERSEAAPVEESNPPISPVNIKDEPIDEGYDAALLPQSSIKQIKEELEHQEEELRISSVYSVGGANTFAAPTMPAPVQAPPQATIFIPSRGAVLQAMAPFPVRPPPPVQIHNSIPALTSVPPRPPPPPVPGSVRCSGCSKVLLKGQTAFQRKGSTQLFCSTVCLTGHLPPASKNRSCFQCNREIIQPRDMITIPTEDNNYMHFCGQFCLSVFRHKKKQTDKFPDKWVEKRPERKPEKLPEKAAERQPEKPVCSVCKVSNRLIEHEVTHQGRLHRLCSNACFVTWRKMRQLAMNCCEGCGLYCNSNSGSCQTLVIDRSQLNFCSPTCIGTYKQTCRKMIECANCHKMALVSTTIMERDQKGKVQLYCSPACVELSRPAQHILSGAAFPCCQCKVSAVPQYHLAMVDGTIRNFCSLDCVSGFRKSSHISQPDLINGNSTLREYSPRDPHKPGSSAGASSVPPIPQDYSSSVPYQSHHPSHTSVPPLVSPYPGMSSPSVPGQVQAKALAGQPQKLAEGRPIDTSKLTCHQCNRQFNIKPVLFSHQSRISMFCSRSCCDQYKTLKNITAVCEYCKQEKILFDTISYNQQDLIFCSDNCKVLFKHELTSRNKDHPWHPCTYCSGASQKMLHSHYGGRMEEFCRPHCMSQYTVLYYGMGRCDGCRKQGYMTEKLQCLGSVRNFCNLPCLLQYCSLHFEMSQHTSSNGTGTTPQTPYAPAQPNHSSKMNPVIADVVSLANGSATQPSDTALTGALPTSVDGKNLDHASTQTDAVRPGPRRRQMKNKSVLCRPFTMDQESSCQLSEPSPELAAVSISAPNLLDSTLQPGRSSADASTSPPPSPKPHRETQQCSGVPSRLTGRHFLGKRDADSDCKVCSQRKRKRVEDEEKQQQEEEKKKKKIEENIETGTETGEAKEAEGGVSSHCENDGARKKEEHCDMKDAEQKSVTLRKQTSYYCKTCSGEPSLCPVPCFELFHTRLIYRTAPELEAQASFSVNLSTQQEKVKVLLVPVPVPVFIPVPMNMYSQHAPVPLTMPLPIPVPIVVPPQKKDTRDAGVQSEPLAVREEKPKVEPFSRADQSSPHSGDRKPDMIARIVHSGDMKQDVVSRSPQSDNLKTDLITRSPESDDMKTDMITHSPHSDDMKTDMITRSFHSDKMKLEVVPCIPHSDDVKTDMIAHSSQGDDMNTDMITRSPDSGGMKIDTMTRNPQSDDMKTDVVTCISHGGHMKQEVVTHSPHGGDMKTDVVTRSPHGGDMKTDLVNRSPHRGDMKTDLVTRSPHDGDMKTDVVTRSPHGGDMKTDVVTRSPHGGDMKTDLVNRSPHRGDMKTDLVTRSPHGGDMKTDLVTRSPHGGDMKTDLVNRSPHRGDMKTDLVTHSPHDGDMKTDVVTRSPHGGDMKTDVVTRSPHGGDMKTDLVTRSPHDGDMKTDVVTRSPHDGDMKTDVVTRSPHGGDMKPDVVTPMLPEHEETQKAVQAELPPPASPEKNSESADPCKSMQAETSTTLSDQPTTSIGQPPSPMMDLETDFPSVSLDKKPSAPQRGVKRPREGFSGRKRGRRRIAPPDSSAAVTPDASKVNHLYGVKAWKSWVQHRAKQVGEVDVKEDVLQCDVAELSFALSHFIKEVRRPNGETYSPDSIFYLCLGIQQYLFMGGRIENIFTDERYSQFVNELTRMLQLWKPKLLPTGGVVSSRVVESYLWECKQLGAYSPIVLLNTLLFFCTKSFHFTTLAQHQTLCFNRITLCSKPCTRAGKVHYLRFHRGSAATPRETERLRKKQAEEEGDVEILESVTNLLHCPVRLYEFYLSRCPDSVRQRTDLFYLQPERNVHTHSPHWYTAQPLEDSTLQSMLTRILAVREVHPEQEAEQRQSSATPDDESLP